ncbi:MAG: hypothetical protein WBW62_11565 [Solirubrobacterales bacterium]
MPPEQLTVELFVAESGWRLAKTMLDNPHQYTVRDLLNADGRHTTAMGNTEFEWFCEQIFTDGYTGRWDGRTYTYLHVGEWKYWTMGLSPKITTIINRKPIGPEAARQLNLEVEAARGSTRRNN